GALRDRAVVVADASREQQTRHHGEHGRGHDSDARAPTPEPGAGLHGLAQVTSGRHPHRIRPGGIRAGTLPRPATAVAPVPLTATARCPPAWPPPCPAADRPPR